MTKYEDASWHAEGDFPPDLDPERACTHIALFLGWAVDRGLEGEFLREECDELLAAFRARRLSPIELLHAAADDQLTDEDLNDEGNAFAAEYLDNKYYYTDYESVLGGDLPSLYHVECTWENYELMAARLDLRLAEWRVAGRFSGGEQN
jgi:hypothetical protein